MLKKQSYEPSEALDYVESISQINLADRAQVRYYEHLQLLPTPTLLEFLSIIYVADEIFDTFSDAYEAVKFDTDYDRDTMLKLLAMRLDDLGCSIDFALQRLSFY